MPEIHPKAGSRKTAALEFAYPLSRTPLPNVQGENMSSSKLARLGGPMLLLGGLLFIVYAAGNALVERFAAGSVSEATGHAIYHVFNVPPNAALAVGMVGLYAYLRRNGNFGKLGKTGFWICAVVFALTAVGGLGIIVSETTLGGAGVAILDIVHPMVLLLMLGSILFGVAVFRSGGLPKGAALMLIVVPMLLVGSLFALGGPQWAFIGGFVLFGFAWAWLGHGLRSHTTEEVARPAVT